MDGSSKPLLAQKKIYLHTQERYISQWDIPVKSRGGHYHPEAVEWFTVIQGEAILRLEDINTRERMEIPMSLHESKSVFVPNNVAHDFISSGETDYIVLAYTDKLYDPADTIAYKL